MSFYRRSAREADRVSLPETITLSGAPPSGAEFRPGFLHGIGGKKKFSGGVVDFDVAADIAKLNRHGRNHLSFVVVSVYQAFSPLNCICSRFAGKYHPFDRSFKPRLPGRAESPAVPAPAAAASKATGRENTTAPCISGRQSLQYCPIPGDNPTPGPGERPGRSAPPPVPVP